MVGRGVRKIPSETTDFAKLKSCRGESGDLPVLEI